jgi:hypothetical protein
MRERAVDIAQLLTSDGTYIYVCGLKGMEDGVSAGAAVDCGPKRARLEDAVAASEA